LAHTFLRSIALLALCAFPALGGTIQAAKTIHALNYSDTDTTVGRTSQVNNLPSGVSNFQTVAGPDVFYIFLVVNSGSMTFTVTPTLRTFDVSIYLSSGKVILDDIINNKVATGVFIGADAGGLGDSETFTVNSIGPGLYLFGVDSFYAGDIENEPNRQQGAFSLTVSGTAELGDPIAPVPEPATSLMMAGGLVFARWIWRKGRQVW